MGIDIVPLLVQWPLAEIATLLVLTAAYAAAFQVLSTSRLQGSDPIPARTLVVLGGLGFAFIAWFLQSGLMAYTGQPPTFIEAGLLAIGFLAMGLAGSGLSVRWMLRPRNANLPPARAMLSVVALFWAAVLLVPVLFRAVVAGMLLLLLTG